MAELTKQKIEELIVDEEKAHKEYLSYGLYSIARDEKRHATILKKMLKQC